MSFGDDAIREVHDACPIAEVCLAVLMPFEKFMMRARLDAICTRICSGASAVTSDAGTVASVAGAVLKLVLALKLVLWLLVLVPKLVLWLLVVAAGARAWSCCRLLSEIEAVREESAGAC